MRQFRATPIKLSDNIYEDITSKIQILKTCVFYHPQYGKVDITTKLLSEMVTNFNNKVRGIDLMIDYSHNSDLEAAGWIRGLELVHDTELNQDQLWAQVEWTPRGRRTLSDKEFAYISADFDPNYKDNEDPSKAFGAVLLGAGLTNRPVIKRMNPVIQLSEYEEKEIIKDASKFNFDKREKNMDDLELKKEEPKKEEIASEEPKKLEEDDVMVKLKSFMDELGLGSVEDLMKLVSSMREEKEMMEKQLSESKAEKELTEKKSTFDKLMKDGFVIEAQREEVLKLSESEFNSFAKIAKMNKPSIKLDEIGNSKDIVNKDERDVEEIISEKAIELAEKEKIPHDKAMSIVLSENKELAKKYYEKQ